MIREYLAEAWGWVSRGPFPPMFLIFVVFMVAILWATFPDGDAEARRVTPIENLRERVTKLERIVDRQTDKLLRTRYKTSKLTIDGEYVIGHRCADLDAIWDEFGRLECGTVARR